MDAMDATGPLGITGTSEGAQSLRPKWSDKLPQIQLPSLNKSSGTIGFAKTSWDSDMAVCQNLVPLVNIKIAGKWMFIPLKMVLIGIDPYPYGLWWLCAI